MARKGENIYKRKDGRWEGRYVKTRTENKIIQYGFVYAQSYREVKSKIRQILVVGEKDEGILLVDTFQKVAEEWLDSIRVQIKESSYAKYSSMVRNHIIPQLGNIPLSKLTVDQLEGFVNEQLASGKKNGEQLSPKTVKDIFSIIKLILDWASRQKHMMICQPERVRIKARERDVEILSLGCQKQLEGYLLPLNDRISDGILLSLYTGIRVGELCALKWENILLEEGILQIRYTLQRIPNIDFKEGDSVAKKTKVIRTSPKSSCSNRDIPLPDFILQRLKKIHKVSKDAYFLTGSHTSWIEPRCMNNYYKRILRQCGIAESKYHILRHTFATRCIEKNFDVKALSEILGHASVNITLNRYVHVSMDQKRKNMNMLTL